MIEVVNRQRKKKIVTGPWCLRAEEMLKAIGRENSSATVAFVSDAKIRQLNKTFRGIDRATDVLSFPTLPEGAASDLNLGDIAISVERAQMQAKNNRLSFNEEVAQLMLHGLLHLCGFDHETDRGQMNRLELKLREKLGI
jgi:probable rRNA maturation factor